MHCWARYLLIAIVTVLGIGQMVAACGQKGDLYLPEPEPKETPPAPRQPDPVPAPDSSEAPAKQAEAN